MPNGRVSEMCNTREEAETLRAALVEERAALDARGELEPAKAPEPPAPLTLAAWGQTWLQRREARVRWFANDKSRWKLYVAPSPFAAVPLAEIRAKHIRTWLADLATTKHEGKYLTAGTVRHVFNLVRKSLADAMEEELITANPAIGVKVPKRPGAVESAPREFLTADEIRAVATCAAIPEASRLFYAVAVHTGLREGELIALRWGDVREDGARPEVVVRGSHDHAPKNGKVEPVPQLPQARVAFVRLRELARDEDGEGPAADALVFPSPRGHQRQKSDDFGWSSRKVRGVARVGHRELAGVNRRVLFHGLRHSCGSHLLMGTFGMTLTLAEVGAILRHEDVETTDGYAHLVPGHLHDRIASMTAAPESTAPTLSTPRDPDTAPVMTQLGHGTHPNLGHDKGPTFSKPLIYRARDAGVEPATLGFGDPRSIQLS